MLSLPTEQSVPQVKYFRERRVGPESTLEDALSSKINDFLYDTNHPTWAAGSLPIGAGIPDLIIVSLVPELLHLSHPDRLNPYLLSYLRSVKRVRLPTIVERLKLPVSTVMQSLDSLTQDEVIRMVGGNYSLAPRWRNVLQEVVTIETKISDWKKATSQAKRNLLFSNRSYVALPISVAQRIKKEAILTQSNIGLIGVQENGELSILRRTKRRNPVLWSYYYGLASVIANHTGDGDALLNSN